MMLLEYDVPIPKTPRYLAIKLTTDGIEWEVIDGA